MQLAKNDFGSVFGFAKKLWYSVQFQFYKINCSFGFWNLRFRITFFVNTIVRLCFYSIFARNDALPCWIGPTNCQLKWHRTRHAEIRHEEKYFDSLTVDPIMLEDELWMRHHEKPSKTHEIVFLKTELWKVCFRFLNFEISWVRFGFCARQHICYSAYMLSPVRPSVRLSHGWISQKRLKLGSCNFHHQVAPRLLVSSRLTSPRNSKGNLGSEGAK